MRNIIGKIVTLLIVLPILCGSVYLLGRSIDLSKLSETVFDLEVAQIHYLLLLVVCLILLYEVVDQPLSQLRLETLLSQCSCATRVKKCILQSVWVVITVLLLVLGIIVPLLDLIGSIPFSIRESIPELVPKITLLLLSGTYIYYLLGRPSAQARFVDRFRQRHGMMSILNRAEDHKFMSSMLDKIAEGGEILVTHFEEPQNPMQSEGFYYERDFMRKWYSTVRKKALRVTQIVLINSRQDVDDFERRLSLAKDISTYSLAYILAPPSTIFVDFMVVPDWFALVGFSDDKGMRNMNVYSLLLSGGESVSRFEHLFKDILLAEATYVKTFEGVNRNALDELQQRAGNIARSSSKVLRDLFNFSKS